MKFLMTLLILSLGLVSCSPSKKSSYEGKVVEFVSDGNGFNTKTIFYIGESEVVAFDSQFTDFHAKESIKLLRKHTNKPISWLVVTHPNPDKFNGINVFKKEGAKVISSTATAKAIQGVHNYKKYFFVNMAKMFTEKTYPKLGTISKTFSKSYDLRLNGGEVISLKEYNQKGVSSNQTVALLPSNKGLVVGDLVHHKAHAWLEGGIVNGSPVVDIKSWIKVLTEIGKDFNDDILVYGGRGKVTTLKRAIPEQITYLKEAKRIVGNYVKNTKVSELKSNKAQNHYKKISEIFGKKFSSYELNYMIQYGVYGFVNSLIK